jgi:TPR repeat protein
LNDEEINEGLKLFEAGKFSQAFKVLLPLAERGYAEAETKIGLMYYLGDGVARDIKEAKKWLESAAEKGVGEAAHNLGTLYLTCEPDLPRDEKKSKEWYKKAKELGTQVAPDDWYK